MQPPPVKPGWERTSERRDSVQYPTLEEAFRDLFETLLSQAMAEMERQNASGEAGKSFNSWGILKSEYGQEFKISIEGNPPTPPDPSLN